MNPPIDKKLQQLYSQTLQHDLISIYRTKNFNKKRAEKAYIKINHLINQSKLRIYLRVCIEYDRSYKKFIITIPFIVYRDPDEKKELEKLSEKLKKSFTQNTLIQVNLEDIINIKKPLTVIVMVFVAFIIAILLSLGK